MKLLGQNVIKGLIVSLICWFVYSCVADVINLWKIPTWLQIIGLMINGMSLSWLVMTYYNKDNFQYRVINIMLMLWFSPAWIYLDMNEFSPTKLVYAETFIVDVSMLLLLIYFNFSARLASISFNITISDKTQIQNNNLNYVCN